MHGKIAVTLGDPAGIGPEIVAKSLPKLNGALNRIIVVGNVKNFRSVCHKSGIRSDIIDMVEVVDIDSPEITPGQVQKEAGVVAIKAIEEAVKLWKSGIVSGISTAPISKEAIRLAGSSDMDHTSMLSRLTGGKRLTTLFRAGNLATTFATKHLPLRDAISRITGELVYDSIELADISLRLLGSPRRRIAVAALNPHGGESGLLGTEEKDIILPTVEEAKKRFNVYGPFPADSIYHRANMGEFDVVVSLYHDQGHIACKMLDFDGTISMNPGLPFLRTSVDHGTAFDIAGKGIARERSMYLAIQYALDMADEYSENFAAIL